MAYIVGIGEVGVDSAIPEDSLGFAVLAARRAFDDAGMDVEALDGVLSYGLYGDLVPSDALGYALGSETLSISMDLNLGGQAPAQLISLGAEFVNSRKSRALVVFRALRGRTGVRVGSAEFPRLGEDARTAAGVHAYPIVAGLWARAYLDGTGLSDDDLGEAVLFAERAESDLARITGRGGFGSAAYGARKLPDSIADYRESPMISSPLRRYDCVTEVDGAAAILIVDDDFADQVIGPKVRVDKGVWRSKQTDVDMSSVLGYGDLSRNISWALREALADQGAPEPSSMDVVSVYDCFSSVLMQSLEGLGLCGFGEAPRFLRDLKPLENGPWLNPGGGMLRQGYLHGMNNAVAAVRALRFLASDRGVDAHGIVVSGGMSSGSAVCLTAIGS